MFKKKDWIVLWDRGLSAKDRIIVLKPWTGPYVTVKKHDMMSSKFKLEVEIQRNKVYANHFGKIALLVAGNGIFIHEEFLEYMRSLRKIT